MENFISDNSDIKSRIIFTKVKAFVLILFSIEPIIANIIAILLGVGILWVFSYSDLFPNIGKFHHYITYFIYFLITLQTIKSATKSLLIPVLAFAIASIGFIAIKFTPDLQIISITLCKELMLLGVIGVATSILVIK